jgi:hypothetical protein
MLMWSCGPTQAVLLHAVWNRSVRPSCRKLATSHRGVELQLEVHMWPHGPHGGLDGRETETAVTVGEGYMLAFGLSRLYCGLYP